MQVEAVFVGETGQRQDTARRRPRVEQAGVIEGGQARAGVGPAVEPAVVEVDDRVAAVTLGAQRLAHRDRRVDRRQPRVAVEHPDVAAVAVEHGVEVDRAPIARRGEQLAQRAEARPVCRRQKVSLGARVEDRSEVLAALRVDERLLGDAGRGDRAFADDERPPDAGGAAGRGWLEPRLHEHAHAVRGAHLGLPIDRAGEDAVVQSGRRQRPARRDLARVQLDACRTGVRPDQRAGEPLGLQARERPADIVGGEHRRDVAPGVEARLDVQRQRVGGQARALEQIRPAFDSE